ncbi:MAG TPA: TIGR03790 family protein [Bacteroidales bacterium]|nr:TIGR03790 family protein [Bacteroidales bacterium]
MKRQILITLTFVLFAIFAFAQTTTYDDVGVIVNDNSPASLAIGQYFMQARNIPPQNMIHIQTITDEEIDTTEFRNIQYQIKNYILQNQLQDQLHYLVTTKGVPFDIAVDSCSILPPQSWKYCSTVESELTLLFSADSTRIIQQGHVQNPWYKSTAHIEDSDTDLLLVSRLDGNTLADVYALIDRSGPGSYVNKELGQLVFDISYPRDSITASLFINMMQPAIDTLTNRGWNAFLHSDSLVPSELNHVISYIGFIHKLVQEPLNFSWEKGSFAELIVPVPDFTFYDSLNYSDALQLSTMIGEGCTGGATYVHATFASLITNYAVFFDRYTLQQEHPYNLAESYYMATKTLSWMNLLVGDPKTTITTQGGSSVESPAASATFRLYPNPANGFVNIGINNPATTEISVLILDQMGRVCQRHETPLTAGRNDVKIDISQLDAGLYILQIEDQKNHTRHVQKLMVGR